MPSYFDPSAGPGGRWRDEVTGRFVKTPEEPVFYQRYEDIEEEQSMWRITIAINGVYHYEYFSVMVWKYQTEEATEEEIQYLKDRAKDNLYNAGYMKENWIPWYSIEPSVGQQRVRYEADLVGKIEEDIEVSYKANLEEEEEEEEENETLDDY